MRPALASLARFAPVIGAIVLAHGTSAQTIHGYDTSGRVQSLIGPPVGPCGYPGGPSGAMFVLASGSCAAPGNPVPPLGAVATDATTDLFYVSDGPTIGVFDVIGRHRGSHPSPLGPITGMGIDGATGLLWVTDGLQYGALALPLPLCGAAASLAAGPFAVPVGSMFSGPIAGLDWDPDTASLWACDAVGNVGNFLPATSLPGPFGAFTVSAGTCGLAPALVGITVDRAVPAGGVVYVTDGTHVARIGPSGSMPAPTFHAPTDCFPALAQPVVGLGQSAHAIAFGNGGDSTGQRPPFLGSVGQVYPGNTELALLILFSLPGASARLRVGSSAPCPAPMALGLPILVGPPSSTLSGSVTVDPFGSAAFRTPVPPSVPPGASVYVQGVVLAPGRIQVTQGLFMTATNP